MKSILENWRVFLSEQKGCSPKSGCNCIDSSFMREKGISVKDVQNFLFNNGYREMLQKKSFKSGKADGLCGDETKAAIMKFQSDRGIKCDACVGPETWAEIQRKQEPSKPQKSEKTSTGNVQIKKISEGLYFVGTIPIRPDRVTLHIIGSGRNQRASTVASSILNTGYPNSQGDVLVSQYGKKFFPLIKAWLSENKYSSTRIVGFSRGARAPGGAWDYALQSASSQDELVLLDPAIQNGIQKSPVPQVSKILFYFGSKHMARVFQKRWKILSSMIQKSNTNAVIKNEPTTTSGFPGHMEYFTKFYKNPSIMGTTSSQKTNKLEPKKKVDQKPVSSKKSRNDLTKPYIIPFDMTRQAFNSIRISGYGVKRAGGQTHAGVDYFLENKTPVYAIADGRVSKSYYLGTEMYEKMSLFIKDAIKKEYGHEVKLINGDIKRFLGSDAKNYYSLAAKKEGVSYGAAYKKIRDLFLKDYSPYKDRKIYQGRWWAGISFRTEHSQLEENPKNLRYVRYLHLQDIYVKPGDFVKKGQLIGTVGRTGMFESPDHLHLEIYSPDKVGRSWLLDPENIGYLKNRDVT